MEKPDKAIYAAIHYWLKVKYGAATKCENIACYGNSKNYQWAKKRSEVYDFKRENFIELCASCHGRYDTTDWKKERLRDANKNTHKSACDYGHPFNAENTRFRGDWRQCKACGARRNKEWRLRVKTALLANTPKE